MALNGIKNELVSLYFTILLTISVMLTHLPAFLLSVLACSTWTAS